MTCLHVLMLELRQRFCKMGFVAFCPDTLKGTVKEMERKMQRKFLLEKGTIANGNI